MTQPVPISGPRAFVPERIGRYEIVGELGQGGMGAIYLGRASGLGGFERLVAIKMIHRHLSNERQFIDMFLDEARIAASIRHPHVVSVFEVGEEGGRYFIAMDYVSGDPFSILLDRTWGRGVSMPAHTMAHVVAIACEGLHAAHELEDPMTRRPLGVVHRDICPQNILVGYDGIVRLMDFGVAKAAGQIALTNPGVHKGKVPYMSPEQVKGSDIDRRSDVFAMGVVLWEATVGRRLFKDENDLRSAARVLRGRVPKPTQIIDAYPAQLETIVMTALAAKPEHRFQTARELGDALQGFISTVGRLGARDVANLMKAHCADRLARKKEIERRASVESLEAGPILDRTTQELFIGDEQLPSHDLEYKIDPDDLEEVSAVLLGLAAAGDGAAEAEPKTEQIDVRSPGFSIVRTAAKERAPEDAFFRDTTPPGGVEEATTKQIEVEDTAPKYTMPIVVAVATAAVLGVTLYIGSLSPDGSLDDARPAVAEGHSAPSQTPTEESATDRSARSTPGEERTDDADRAPDARDVPVEATPREAVEPARESNVPDAAEREAPDAPPQTKARDRVRRRTPTNANEKAPKEDTGRFLIGPEDL